MLKLEAMTLSVSAAPPRWTLPSFFAFFLYYVVIQAVLMLPQSTRILGPIIPAAWWQLLGSSGAVLACLAGLLPGLLKRDGLRVSDLGWVLPVKASDALFGLACGCGIYAVKAVYRHAISGAVSGAVTNVFVTSVFDQLGKTALDRFGFLLGLVILAPLAEELVFSAYALTSLERVWGKTPARTAAYVLIAAVLFSAIHSTGHILHSLGYVLSGILLRLVYVRSRSLPATFLAHATVNLLGEMT